MKSFSGALYDGNGKLLRRFKMSDIQVSEYSESLSTDDKHYFMDVFSPVIPYTIEYQYEVSWNNGHLSFPTFAPQRSPYISVENASSSLTVPSSLDILSYNSGYKIGQVQKSENKGNVTYKWTIENLVAPNFEILQPSFEEYIPVLFVRPEKFMYDNIPGDFSNWNSMGKWLNNLLVGRDELPTEAQDKIKALTKDCTSDRQKVKVLYDHLAQTTRYVSIQLGIGGYQPMLASDVHKTGFGDCKALTNYMKAMLKVVDIQSYYCSIYSGSGPNKVLFAQYPNFNQQNHVILEVPLDKETLWLECTNAQQIPLGFVHSDIAGSQALEISTNGGRIVTLPSYEDSLNVKRIEGEIKLTSNGTAKGTMQEEYRVQSYEDIAYLAMETSQKQADCIRDGIQLSNCTIEKTKIIEYKDQLPSLSISYDFSTTLYGNKSGNRLFVPINPFRKAIIRLKPMDNRTREVEIKVAFNNSDSLFIAIPDDFQIEAIPKPQIINSPFGTLHSAITSTEGGIVVVQKLKLNKGRYSAHQYPDLMNFMDKVNDAYSNRITLNKKSN